MYTYDLWTGIPLSVVPMGRKGRPIALLVVSQFWDFKI